jgi:hypothetical protein
MFSFSGSLIDGKTAHSWLVSNASNVTGNVSICSAFLRSSIIEDLSSRFNSGSSVRVLVRWQLGDLLAGASDLASYEASRTLGWKFYVCLNFHGKVFHLPPHGILVGSANATESGLGLSSNSNSEVCTIVEDEDSNRSFINNLFLQSVEMSDDLFEQIKVFYDQLQKKDLEDFEWPESIVKNFQIQSDRFTGLFLSECFQSDGKELLSGGGMFSDAARSDLSLLGLSKNNISNESIAIQFKKSKIYSLLFELVERRGGEVYFGALSVALQHWLIEDPALYRKEVKVLVSNIYSWVANLNADSIGLCVDRPNYSERIRLTL